MFAYHFKLGITSVYVVRLCNLYSYSSLLRVTPDASISTTCPQSAAHAPPQSAIATALRRGATPPCSRTGSGRHHLALVPFVSRGHYRSVPLRHHPCLPSTRVRDHTRCGKLHRHRPFASSSAPFPRLFGLLTYRPSRSVAALLPT